MNECCICKMKGRANKSQCFAFPTFALVSSEDGLRVQAFCLRKCECVCVCLLFLSFPDMLEYHTMS